MCFAGLFDENGDDYIDYSNMSAAELAEEINPEVDECMCIVENLQMWEEENIDIDLDGGVSAVNEQEQLK